MVDLLNPNTPIIGQQSRIYHLGGHALGFPASVDDIRSTQTAAVRHGAMPTIHVASVWAHASIHTEHHDAELAKLQRRCARLELLCADLAKAAGIELPALDPDDEPVEIERPSETVKTQRKGVADA